MWEVISKFLGPLVTIILALCLMQKCSESKKYKDLANRNPKQIEVATEIIDRYLDSSSNEHIVFKPILVTPDEVEDEFNADLYRLIDSFSNELKIAKRRIREVSSVNSSYSSKTKGTLTSDTLIQYSDNSTKWSFNLADTTLNYNTNLRLNRVDYDDSKRFLGFNINAKNLYSDMWWDNENIRINDVNRVVIRRPVPNNNIKLSSKSEYRFNSNSMLTGASADIQLNRFTIEFSLLRDFKHDENEKSIGFKYHIIK